MYRSQLIPNEEIRTVSKEYDDLTDRHIQLFGTLESQLSGNQKEMLGKLVECCTDMVALDVETAFINGFKTGAQWSAEVFCRG